MLPKRQTGHARTQIAVGRNERRRRELRVGEISAGLQRHLPRRAHGLPSRQQTRRDPILIVGPAGFRKSEIIDSDLSLVAEAAVRLPQEAG